jgi:hypothetical protein
MDDNILALLYPVIRDFPEAPISPALISKAIDIDESELSVKFHLWYRQGLLEKKYQTVEVYRFTEKGLKEVKRAHEEMR